MYACMLKNNKNLLGLLVMNSHYSLLLEVEIKMDAKRKG